MLHLPKIIKYSGKQNDVTWNFRYTGIIEYFGILVTPLARPAILS